MPKLPAPPELAHIRWAVAQGMLTADEDFHLSLGRWLLEDDEPDDDKRKDDDKEKDDDGSELAENKEESSGSSGARPSRAMDDDRKKDDDKKKDDDGSELARSESSSRPRPFDGTGASERHEESRLWQLEVAFLKSMVG